MKIATTIGPLDPEEAYRQAYTSVLHGVEMKPVYEPLGDYSMPISRAINQGKVDALKELQTFYRNHN